MAENEELIEDKTGSSTAALEPKQCPNCGHMNPHTRTTCRKCKTPLPENVTTVRCPECGVDVREDDEKCPYCGLPIEEVKARTQFKLTGHKYE